MRRVRTRVVVSHGTVLPTSPFVQHAKAQDGTGAWGRVAQCVSQRPATRLPRGETASQVHPLVLLFFDFEVLHNLG